MMQKKYLLAVMGSPIQHSLSPQIHHFFAQLFGLNLEYRRIEVNAEDLAEQLNLFKQAGATGANITAPCKHQAFSVCTETSERAEKALAVNTIVFKADGSLYGDNTDGAGLVHDLKENLDFNLKGKRLFILGAGGAVSGILTALLEEKPCEIIIFNRDLKKAEALVQRFSAYNADTQLKAAELVTLWDESKASDLILNALDSHADLSLWPKLKTQTSTTLAYDLKYGPRSQTFLNWALQTGISHRSDGLGMLIEQAAVSFELWTELKPKDYFKPLMTQCRSVQLRI